MSRSQWPAEQRQARSRAVQHIVNSPLIRGSLVVMARSCGKEGCHCRQGEKHVSLYLAVRLGGRRRMIYVPSAMEAAVRGWVANAQEVDRLLDFVSQQCLAEFLHQKEEKLGRSSAAGVRKGRPRRKPP